MDLREDIVKTEEKFKAATELKYNEVVEEIRRQIISDESNYGIDILRFHDCYLANKTHPLNQLDKLCELLLDVKMEHFYIFFDIAVLNELFGSVVANPLIELKRLSFDQSLIVKSRILWERVMNFLYYLENGEELKGFHKANRFFKSIEGTNWEFLLFYKDYVDWFDVNLRTPEVHHGSCLRKYFINSSDLTNEERNKSLGLLNLFQNAIYKNVLSLLEGKGITNYFWRADFGKNPFDDQFFKNR
ncbi:hypothetical protein A2V71_01310 [Candidatus Berkelbacteria bacterium RBG_13_40_8]|uniref:Cthe-2314-like HEPN domain-containing protein n=1 Tax=Candidatus Berkelbacteria bacterium RBG_13_40_8 TaxID=1797467 RepID=A0A1F5DMT1_9BACT|nr:MAG: hypothetical protein A2V71_01310 [Candidatus Berkelbacteria bacterium RBG_13_40_8]